MHETLGPPVESTSSVDVIPEIARTNIETLQSKGELGLMFSALYEAALDEEPRLAEVKVWAIGPETPGFDFLKHTGGAAWHKDNSSTGRYEVVMNTDDGIEHFERLLSTRRASAEISAKKIGIEKNKITPEQLASFIFLHELGHLVDYMDNAPDSATYSERRNRDMEKLPIPGFNPAELAKSLETREGKKRFFDNVRSLHSKFGISSMHELMVLQETAYHDVETEDIPDRFAARVMRKLGIV